MPNNNSEILVFRTSKQDFRLHGTDTRPNDDTLKLLGHFIYTLFSLDICHLKGKVVSNNNFGNIDKLDKILRHNNWSARFLSDHILYYPKVDLYTSLRFIWNYQDWSTLVT